MKKVIFTQEWMEMHPYEKPDEVDQYYTELANEIYHALDEACFTHNFKNVDDAKHLALSIAGYFEDVLSGTHIWKTFTTECMKRYGYHVPFYENETRYVNNALSGNNVPYAEDEINFADLKFILWHHYQQSSYMQEAVPFLFGTLELAAKMVYDILDKEYETAPENERLYDFLCNYDAKMEKNVLDIARRDILAWFHYGCYFNLGNQKRLQFTLQQMANSPQGLSEQIAYNVQMDMTITLRNNLLALTSYEWLLKITAEQPSHAYWENEDFQKLVAAAEEEREINHEQGIKDYNLLKAKGYGDKFVFLEDNKALKEFLKEIGYELPANIQLPQKYEKGIIVCGSPYTGINITYQQAHNIASPENPYYDAERAEDESFGIICGAGRSFPYEIVCKLIDGNMLVKANCFTSKYVKAAGLQITQDHLQFLADYYLLGRKDKDLSPKELW